MDYPVAPARAPLAGPFPVPPSKSEHQRCLALASLAGRRVRIVSAAGGQPGEDVQRLDAALTALGPWQAGHLGAHRASLRLDLGEGATGFRYALALATLRPPGARTLVTGRPALRARAHGGLLRALRGLGAHVIRRRSGAVRVIGGGMRSGRLTLDPTVSSQFASTLLLLAPRLGGLDLRLAGRSASLPYLRTTLTMLERFGIPVLCEGLEGPAGRIVVGAAVPAADEIVLASDASCAAAWWSAAALCGGEATVPGLGLLTAQADVRLLGLLERMGARVETQPDGSARVRADGSRLRALGRVDLTDSPDLVFLLGVLAASAQGETELVGVSATRRKESDRVALLAIGLRVLGAEVSIQSDDCVRICGTRLHGGRVDVGADHRAAFAFGILGLRVPGLVLGGARRAVGKSHPGFLEALAGLAGEHSERPGAPVP